MGNFDSSKPKGSTPVKLSVFTAIDPLRSKLSGNGIGQLYSWQYVDGVDWQAITNYFDIGRGLNEWGLQNNLAYYFSSSEEPFVESFQLVLNINVSSEQKYAKNKMISLTKKSLLHWENQYLQVFSVRLITKLNFEAGKVKDNDFDIRSKN
ncbi:hypothetical protein DSL64_03040 [Dyadobacter luteus]|uniref:Uncharacterized protein n=1 Tax=Dyadobacter luteus TaxID=2259619 RepID=A0A3D8YGC0_9BACT|nr:hypothetical protein [Dyadobacter luteus]REA63439.1 hypothetical protein DSL64_03040 [Dyadobacter luteus]